MLQRTHLAAAYILHQQYGSATGRARRSTGAHVGEAVVEVEADEAGREARVGDARVLDDAPGDVVGAGARLVVERGAQRHAAAARSVTATVSSSSSQSEQERAVRGYQQPQRRDARGSCRHCRSQLLHEYTSAVQEIEAIASWWLLLITVQCRQQSSAGDAWCRRSLQLQRREPAEGCERDGWMRQVL
jgi:hypothetical protein